MGTYRNKIDNNIFYNEKDENSYIESSYAIEVLDDIEYDLHQVQTTLEDINNDSINSLHDGLDKAFEQIEELLRKVY